MADTSDAQIEAAIERGRLLEPRAETATYDSEHEQIVVKLTNGCSFSFPRLLAEGLAAATREQLAAVEILGAGTGLHWEALDVDLSIPGLLAGLFGTRRHMASQAGQTITAVKSDAARLNGAKGGRPRKAG